MKVVKEISNEKYENVIKGHIKDQPNLLGKSRIEHENERIIYSTSNSRRLFV
jgi:hypothetical protein